MLKFMIVTALCCFVGLYLFLAWWKFFFGFAAGAVCLYVADMVFDLNSRKTGGPG